MSNATEQRPEDAVWRMALDHVLARGAGQSGAEEQAAAWRRSDPAHETAFREAEKLWQLTGGLVVPRRVDATPQRLAPAHSRSMSRRRLIGGAALAAAVGGVVLWSPLRLRLQGATVTGTRETRVIALPDGSRMTLGPDSAARIAFVAAERRIELLRGIAFFDVAPDASRPFRVVAQGVVATAVGTQFEVKTLPHAVSVMVAEGKVDVRDAASGKPFGAPLGAGDWMVVTPETGAVETGHRAAAAVASWRDGLLTVENATIRDVIAEIGGWFDGFIYLDDDALGDKRISGTLDLADPEAALQAVLGLYGGRVKRVTSWVLIVSADPAT